MDVGADESPARKRSTPTPLPPGEIGYRSDNRVLRAALSSVWKSTCYMCREPKAFSDMEIDHMIPRRTSATDLPGLIHEHGLDEDFHVDRPCNLALICRPCNRRKSDALLHTLSFTTLLHKAREYAPQVIRWVKDQNMQGAVARGLVIASISDTGAKKTRHEFLTHAPSVVQALALIDAEAAASYTVTRALQIGVDCWPVTLVLDAGGRAAARLIEDICGSTVPVALEKGVADIAAHVDHLVYLWVEERYRRKTTDVGRADVELRMLIRQLEPLRRGPVLSIRFSGRFHADIAVSTADTHPRAVEDGLLVRAKSAEVAGGVQIAATWNLNTDTGEPGDTSFDVGGVEFADLEDDGALPWWGNEE